MKKTICVQVRDKVAVNLTRDVMYVCGNSNFVVDFDFDAEWDEFEAKTARFIRNEDKSFVDVVFQGNRCPVSVLSNTYNIKVGVFAGDLRTTTPALVSARKSILCGIGSPAAPPDDVYNQIMGMLNGIIARVEVLEKGGGGGGSSDQTSAVLGVAMLGCMKLG